MSPFPGLRTAIEETLVVSDMPGMVVAASRDDGPVVELAVGHDADGVPLTADSLFASYSITKVATALAVLRLVDRGDLALDDELGRWVPEAVAGATTGTTLRALLAHCAGMPFMPAPEPPWTLELDWPMLAEASLRSGQATPPGTRVAYSNTGYYLLGVVIERRTGLCYQDALRALVLRPLGIDAHIGEEPPRYTATVGNPDDPHAGTALANPNSRFWRSLGMPDGGLVTTASGALALVRAFDDRPTGFLTASTIAEARRDQTGGLAGGVIGFLEWDHAPWGLGIELRGVKSPYWAPVSASPGSFGHATGTGCLAWVDPAEGIGWAWMATRMLGAWMLDPALPVKAALYPRPRSAAGPRGVPRPVGPS